LRFVASKTDATQLMMGSDYPFPIGDMAPCNIVHKAAFSELDTSAILGGTAARLFQLDGGCDGAHG
jgi:aminocarboxymuconate-semialdehyde decarboxylase